MKAIIMKNYCNNEYFEHNSYCKGYACFAAFKF